MPLRSQPEQQVRLHALRASDDEGRPCHHPPLLPLLTPTTRSCWAKT